MKNIELLWELQQLDNKIIDINKQVGILDLERDLSKYKEMYNNLLTIIKTKAKEYKEKDSIANVTRAEVQKILSNIEISEERLYSGEIKKSKAINQLQREINDNRNLADEKNKFLDDLRRENIKNIKHIKLCKSKLEQLKLKIVECKSLIEDKKKETSDELTEIKRRMEQIKSELLPEEIEFYNTKRESIYPVIVPYTGQCCEGCKMQFSLIFIQNIENNELRMGTCENCGRLIYIPKEEGIEVL